MTALRFPVVMKNVRRPRMMDVYYYRETVQESFRAVLASNNTWPSDLEAPAQNFRKAVL